MLEEERSLFCESTTEYRVCHNHNNLQSESWMIFGLTNGTPFFLNCLNNIVHRCIHYFENKLNQNNIILRYIPLWQVEVLCMLTDYTYTHEDVLLMEQRILSVLQFDLFNPTSFMFLEGFLKIDDDQVKTHSLRQFRMGLRRAETPGGGDEGAILHAKTYGAKITQVVSTVFYKRSYWACAQNEHLHAEYSF